MDSNLRIAIAVGGSIGDVLNTTALAVGLKRKFPQSNFTFFIFKGAEVLRGNKIINTIKIVDFKHFQVEVEKQRVNYDIFCEARYPVKYFFSEYAMDFPEVVKFRKQWERVYLKNYERMWDSFLSEIDLINKACKKGFNVYDLRRHSSLLDYTDDDQFLMISNQDYKASEKYSGLRIVTVNNSGAHGIMTKSWTIEGWIRVVKHLRNRGIYVIQVGSPEDPPILGVHDRFIGTIHETAALIKRAKFNVFIEGGLAHIAKAVGKKSVVLFGPTPVNVFGYKDNINIKGSFCSPCWHNGKGRFDWNRICVLTKTPAVQQIPGCMRSIDTKEVIEAVDKLLIENRIIAKKGIKNV